MVNPTTMPTVSLDDALWVDAAGDAAEKVGWQDQVQRQWRRLQARMRSTWHPLTVAMLAPPHVPGDASAMDAALDALDAWAEGHEGVNLDVQLSSRWLLCCATPDASSAAQAHEMAQQQWEHYFGLEAEQFHADWLVTEVMHGGSKAGPQAHVKLVCAVPRALINGLNDVARERGLRLQAAMPWWAESLQVTWDACVVGTPAATQREGSGRQWAWAEPGLLTRVMVRVREGRWVLERVWVEVRSEAPAAWPEPEWIAKLKPPETALPEAGAVSLIAPLVWQLPDEVSP